MPRCFGYKLPILESAAKEIRERLTLTRVLLMGEVGTLACNDAFNTACANVSSSPAMSESSMAQRRPDCDNFLARSVATIKPVIYQTHLL